MTERSIKVLQALTDDGVVAAGLNPRNLDFDTTGREREALGKDYWRTDAGEYPRWDALYGRRLTSGGATALGEEDQTRRVRDVLGRAGSVPKIQCPSSSISPQFAMQAS